MRRDGVMSCSPVRSARGARARLAVICALAALTLSADASGIDNPHDSAEPRFCLDCHTGDVFTKPCPESDGYCLLGGSVDGICLICHVQEECCKPGLGHLPKLHLGMRSHKSDIEVRDIPPAYYPQTLPVHLGHITCLTCHLHTRVSGGYKMLRLVRVTPDGVDWTVLCRDCHKNF